LLKLLFLKPQPAAAFSKATAQPNTPFIYCSSIHGVLILSLLRWFVGALDLSSCTGK
jgi:hypothetical protein